MIIWLICLTVFVVWVAFLAGIEFGLRPPIPYKLIVRSLNRLEWEGRVHCIQSLARDVLGKRFHVTEK